MLCSFRSIDNEILRHGEVIVKEKLRLDEVFLQVYKASMDELTTKQAAEKLGVSMRWVQALIADKRLPARKIGRDYLIDEKDLKLVEGMKPGPKPKAAKKGKAK